MARVALDGILPMMSVEAKKELNILRHISERFPLKLRKGATYRKSIRERTVHVTQEEVSEFDRIESSQKESPLLKSALIEVVY